MTQEVHLEEIRERAPLVRNLVNSLNSGGIAAVPDDSGLAVLGSSLSDPAAGRLEQILAASGDAGIAAVSVSHSSVVPDYVEHLPRMLEKLVYRCWPGPVVLRVDEGAGLISRRWPERSRRWALTESGRAFYCPAQELFASVLENLDAPALTILLSPTDRAVEALRQGGADWIVHGTPRFADLPTVARIAGETVTVEREGVVSRTLLGRLSGEVYLFVCTGNTCRSPMAEALFRKMLADRLKCREDELMDRGFAVVSAGLAAHSGSPASENAVELLAREGIDLATHASQQVSEELLFHADHVLTMTRQHRDAILGAYPELAGRVRTLSSGQRDVSDPIGGGPEDYARCREDIAGHLRTLIDRITPRDTASE